MTQAPPAEGAEVRRPGFRRTLQLTLLIHSKTSDTKEYLQSRWSPRSRLVANSFLLARLQLVLTFDGASAWESTWCYREAVWVWGWQSLKMLLADASARLSHKLSGPQPPISQERTLGLYWSNRALTVSGKKRPIPNTRRSCFILGCIFKRRSSLK